MVVIQIVDYSNCRLFITSRKGSMDALSDSGPFRD